MGGAWCYQLRAMPHSAHRHLVRVNPNLEAMLLLVSCILRRHLTMVGW